MHQIARTRLRVWFSIAFKKVPDRGSQIQQVAVFNWRQRSEICKRKLPQRALNTVGIKGKAEQPEAFQAEIDPITTFAAPMEVRTCPLFLKEKWLW
jgi:hypothetical protein